MIIYEKTGSKFNLLIYIYIYIILTLASINNEFIHS